MDPAALMLIAVFYVLLQALALFQLDGAWRRAAIFPVPFLCFLLILAVTGGLFGVPGSEIGALIAVPVGLAYLVVLIVAGQVARLVRAQAG